MHANYEVVKLVRYLFHQVYFCSSLVGNLLVKFTWNLKLLANGVWIWKPWGRCLGSDSARISEAVLGKPGHLLGFSTSTQVRVFSEMCKETHKIDPRESKNRRLAAALEDAEVSSLIAFLSPGKCAWNCLWPIHYFPCSIIIMCQNSEPVYLYSHRPWLRMGQVNCKIFCIYNTEN